MLMLTLAGPGAKTTRTQLMQHDAALPLSHSQVGPVDLAPAVSVFAVDVLAKDTEQVRPAGIPRLCLCSAHS